MKTLWKWHDRGWGVFSPAIFFLFVFLIQVNSPVSASSFQGLGTLPGFPDSVANAVSADGSVVVGYATDRQYKYQAFRWTSGGGMVGLGYLPGGIESTAFSVSADGSVIVGRSTSFDGNRAFRWTSGGGMEYLLGGPFHGIVATGVSADGSIIVGTSDSNMAFRWTSGGGMVGLGYLPGGSGPSHANGVSADGSVIIGYGQSSTGPQAFRWTSGGGMVGLGYLPNDPLRSDSSNANAVSADGSVVVGRSTSFDVAPGTPGTQAFRWTSGDGMVGLGYLPGFPYSSANAVSADGSVVVGYGFSSEYVGNAFIWDAAHGKRFVKDVLEQDYGLDLTGWSLTNAQGISPDGKTIVGVGINPSGQTEAWMAHIGPSQKGIVPALMLLLGD